MIFSHGCSFSTVQTLLKACSQVLIFLMPPQLFGSGFIGCFFGLSGPQNRWHRPQFCVLSSCRVSVAVVLSVDTGCCFLFCLDFWAVQVSDGPAAGAGAARGLSGIGWGVTGGSVGTRFMFLLIFA